MQMPGGISPLSEADRGEVLLTFLKNPFPKTQMDGQVNLAQGTLRYCHAQDRLLQKILEIAATGLGCTRWPEASAPPLFSPPFPPFNIIKEKRGGTTQVERLCKT